MDPNGAPPIYAPPPNGAPPQSPPVPIELPVSEAQHFGHHVEAGVEEPIEEDEPDEVVGDLFFRGGGKSEAKRS